MIATLCAMLSMGQAHIPTPATAAPTRPQSPSALLTQVLKRYHDAKSLAGQIRLTQSAKGLTITIDTQVAFDQPSRLLIRQVKSNPDPQQWLTVSDGTIFSYDRPPGVLGRPRFDEKVKQLAGEQTVRTMYGTAAVSLGDRSPVLDILFGRREDLAEVTAHFGSVRYGKPVTIRGVAANVVEGDYVEIPGSEASGSYAIAISEAGDILRYVFKNRYVAPTVPPQTIEVTSTWDVDVKLDVPNPDSTYTRG